MASAPHGRSSGASAQTTDCRVALGFGISRPEHVGEVTAFADAAVVGSALVDVDRRRRRAADDPAAGGGAFVRWLKGRVTVEQITDASQRAST